MSIPFLLDMKDDTKKHYYKTISHHRLVGREHLAQAKHKHHDPEETKQMLAHGLPVHRAWRCVHTVPDVHVKVPVHLKCRRKTYD